MYWCFSSGTILSGTAGAEDEQLPDVKPEPGPTSAAITAPFASARFSLSNALLVASINGYTLFLFCGSPCLNAFQLSVHFANPHTLFPKKLRL